jgi:hypothetical protein
MTVAYSQSFKDSWNDTDERVRILYWYSQLIVEKATLPFTAQVLHVEPSDIEHLVTDLDRITHEDT